MEAEVREKVIDAAGGLTTIEAENAFALSVVESKAIDPVIVAKESGCSGEPARRVLRQPPLIPVESAQTLFPLSGGEVFGSGAGAAHLRAGLAYSDAAAAEGCAAGGGARTDILSSASELTSSSSERTSRPSGAWFSSCALVVRGCWFRFPLLHGRRG
jgi:hypothetical protein